MSTQGEASARPSSDRFGHEFPLQNLIASSLVGLAVFFFGACRHIAPSGSQEAVTTSAAAVPLSPSPRLIVGRVLSVDATRGFAIVDLVADAPKTALVDGTELTSRTLDLRETARLSVSRYIRGRTLGTRIVSGQPAPGDEVVWLTP